MNPRTVCFCQPICSMISASVAPPLRFSIATTRAVLLPSRGPALPPLRWLRRFLGLGRLLGAGGFLVAFSAGAPLAPVRQRWLRVRGFGGVRLRQRGRLDLRLQRGVFLGPIGFGVCVLGLGYGNSAGATSCPGASNGVSGRGAAACSPRLWIAFQMRSAPPSGWRTW